MVPENHEFVSTIALAYLNIFAMFKGGFNMPSGLISNPEFDFCLKILFVELENQFKQRYCKGTSHTLFSTFIYPYLHSFFSPFTAIISGCTLLFK